MKTGYVFKPHIMKDNTERVEFSSPQAQARRAQREIEKLGNEIHRLYMVTEALWTLVKDRTDLTDEQLMNLISEIDLRDNVRSEMAAEAEIQSCPNCGRTLSIRHTTCIFCGEFIQNASYGR
jgi:predicted  nucleic acid-binding Zn-ribbon protein